MALQVATKVSDWVMTSVSGSAPASLRAMCSADVPLTVAMANCAPVYSATNSSKRLTNSPTLETKVESIVSKDTAFRCRQTWEHEVELVLLSHKDLVRTLRTAYTL